MKISSFLRDVDRIPTACFLPTYSPRAEMVETSLQ